MKNKSKNKNTPMRRCIGCMESKPKGSMVRIAYYEGSLTLDTTGKAKGRGVYICLDRECMEKAKKRRAVQRSLEVELSQEDIDNIFGELAEYEEKGN